jgi:hypothetical protein
MRIKYDIRAEAYWPLIDVILTIEISSSQRVWRHEIDLPKEQAEILIEKLQNALEKIRMMG